VAAFVQAPTPVITTAVTSGNIVFGSNVTAGNLLVCWLRMVSPQTVSDNLGDGVAWQRVGAYFGNNTPADKAIWWKIAGATAACTVSVSTGTSGTMRVAVAEYSGTGLIPQAYAQFAMVAGGAGTFNTGPSFANLGDLVVAAIAGPTASETLSAGAAAPNSNLTKLDNNAAGFIGLENEVSWPGGVVNATFSLSPSSAVPDGMAVVFGPRPYAPAFPPHSMPSGV
jgi:hypothetical protein